MSKNSEQIIIFIGPEGSGKSTIARRLSVEIAKSYISTGDMVRDLAAHNKTKLGDECRKVLSANVYLSPRSLLLILTQRFNQSDVKHGFVIDGSLRTVYETKNFKSVLKKDHLSFPIIIFYLQIPREVSHERLVHGSNARRRQGDSLAGLDKRLDEFYFQLDERIKLIKYRHNWKFIEIDATPDPETVYQSVVSHLSGVKAKYHKP
jgi:adenylate kinase family enzyme